MRGVAGMLFLIVGFMMAYLVLTGKLPNAGNLIQPSKPSGSPAPGNTTAQQSQIIANKNIGSGPTGLPTMVHMNDLVASMGGLQ
jgi:hypothetical protein